MAIIGPLRLVVLIGIANVLQLILRLGLGTRNVRKGLRVHHVEVPDVDEAVSGTSSSQNPFGRVPLREEDVTFVLIDDLDALAIRDEGLPLHGSHVYLAQGLVGCCNHIAHPLILHAI